MSQNGTKTGTYANAQEKLIDLSGADGIAPTASVSIFTTGDCTVEVTNESDVDLANIWIPCTLTNNACSVTGPITGVRITGTGDGSYSVRAL